MTDIPLGCRCGTVRGTLKLSSPDAGNHVVCFCADCQAFANYLDNPDEILDQWGGTDIYQSPPWDVEFVSGTEQLRCLRLTPKGLYRWYTNCCQTPVANTVSAKLPFVGLIHSFIDKGPSNPLLGPIRGYHKLECAKGEVPDDIRQKGMPVGTTLRVFWRLFKWKLTAGNKPYPFFDAAGKSVSKPEIVNPGKTQN